MEEISMLNENAVGNPDTNQEQVAVDDAVFGSPDTFFEALDDQVNGAIIDKGEPEQATPQVEGSDVAGTDVEVSQGDEDVENLKKRYSDSSREAHRMKAQLDELKPFVPVLEAMKNDSGLVDYVRDYFVKGGKVPTNIKERLSLDEDFEFDVDEMVNDEFSDSRKVMDAIVDRKVNSEITRVIGEERQKAHQMGRNLRARKEAQELMNEFGMNEEQFGDFIDDARIYYKNNGISYKDMMYLMNRDRSNANVAKSTKDDMIKQMKNVREIPTSQGSANSTKQSESPDDKLFDSLLGLDGGLDNLFS